MKKRIGLIAGFLTLSLATQAFALECSIDYDTGTNKITLEGTAKAPVFVTVLPKGIEDSGISEGKAAAVIQYDWHKLTEFNETIMLNKDLPSGKYCVKVQSNEQYMTVNDTDDRLYGTANNNLKKITEEIYHINIGDAEDMMSDLNSVKNDANALRDMIANGKSGEDTDPAEDRVPYTELLSIDPVAFAQYGTYAAGQIVGTKKGRNFEGTDEVIALLDEYRVLYDAINSADPSSVLVANVDSIDADVERFVKGLDGAAAAKLNTLLKSFKADGKAFSDELPELSALAAVQAADRWQAIEKVVTDTYKDVLNIDYDVKNRDDVFGEMMYYTYNKFSDIKDNFDKADAKINPDTVIIPSDEGGGGGGGGKKGTSLSGPPWPIQTEDETTHTAFSDVPKDFWGYDAICTLTRKGVISGYPDGSFRPSGNVTRAEFVKMLASAFEFVGGDTLPFEDVTPSDWHYSYILAAYANGMVGGVSETAFNPGGAITREDACVIVYRYLSGLGILKDTRASFVDEAEFASYAAEAISSLASNGIVNGVGDNRFDPKASINRASSAVLILNCLNIK